MAHEWHTNQSKNPWSLINEFLGFTFQTDYDGNERVEQIKISSRVFSNVVDARSFVGKNSYGGNAAYLTAYTTRKLTKGYQSAFTNFVKRYNEYLDFSNNLTIAFGRSSSKTTCPNCGSSINLKYGRKFKSCPVCGSVKIISDSNWKTLETKRNMAEKAAENLAKEAEKNDVTFVCGIEWHC